MRRRWRPCSPPATGRRAGHRCRRSQRRVRRHGSDVRRCGAGRHRARRARRDRRRVSGVVEVGAGTFGPDLERELGDAARPDDRSFPPELRASPRSADGSRAAAPGSTPRATARSRTWSSGWRSCSPTDGRPHRRRTGGRRRARPQPALHRLGRHARHDHEGVAASPLRPDATNGRRRICSPRSATASRRAAGSCDAARPRPCSASTTPSNRRAASGGDGTHVHAAGARRGRRRRSSRRRSDVVDDECAAARRAARRRDWSTSGSSTATTRRRCRR